MSFGGLGAPVLCVGMLSLSAALGVASTSGTEGSAVKDMARYFLELFLVFSFLDYGTGRASNGVLFGTQRTLMKEPKKQ